MRRHVWAGLLAATDQEIADGMDFYPGAHGLCRLFSSMHPDVSVAHVAGIYAALSPLNTWGTNVANVLDVLRDWSSAPVNTTDANLHKALRIRCGEDPLHVLRGRKVRAFYRGMADPDNREPIAVDRHLMNLALGVAAPSKREQADMAHDDALYGRVESVYQDLGRRESLGNRLAAIAWFVQRRIERSGQMPMLHPEAPVCCGTAMWSHGRRREQRFFYCPRCRSTARPKKALRLSRTAAGAWTLRDGVDGFRVWPDDKGRMCVSLGQRHPYSNSGGYQRLARFLIAEDLGHLPRSDEHTHHRNGRLTDDRIDNLELVAVEYHGRLHASAAFVGRGEDGRFVERDPSTPPPDGGLVGWPRAGAILGNQAKRGF